MLGANNIRIFLINVMKSLMMTIADVATHTSKSYYYKQPDTSFKEPIYKILNFFGSPMEARDVPFPENYRSVLWLTQPPIRWELGVTPRG
jgi:hypothetical protein